MRPVWEEEGERIDHGAYSCGGQYPTSNRAISAHRSAETPSFAPSPRDEFALSAL